MGRGASNVAARVAASQGVFNFTATDRYGVDDRARVLLTVKNGNYEVIK